MEQTQEQTFEAWVDEKRRLGSFHKIPGARRLDAKKRMLRLSRQDGCPVGGHRFIMDIYIIFLEELCRKGGQITCKMRMF